jgi:DNA-binding MarR family transcriptional regulator
MALRIDRTTMVALLDDLEAKGYVARQRHPHDRRAFLVHPTDSGRLAKVDAVASSTNSSASSLSR